MPQQKHLLGSISMTQNESSIQLLQIPNMNKTNQHTSDKSHFREIVSQHIDTMSEVKREHESRNICLQLKRILRERSTVLIDYIPLRDEVDISAFSRWYSSPGWEVMSIPQSLSTETPLFPENSIILIPGRAFSENGNRIGRWSGYYDKLLEKNPTLRSIWVAFSCQIFTQLPQDSWDQQVDEVVFAENILE